MKKIIALILTFMFIATLGINALALDAAPPPKHYEIPKATPGFTIGDFDTAKWTGALEFNYDTSNCWPAMDGDDNAFLGAKMYFAWAPEGIYFYADIKNKNNVSISAAAIDEAHNRGQGLQFFPAIEATNDLPGWTYSPYTTPDGKADVWRHWPEPQESDADAKIFAKVVDGGYILEGLLPTKGFENPDCVSGGIKIVEGAKFAMSTVFLQAPEEGVHYGWSDTAWFNADEYTTYALAGKVIEGAPAPAPEPEPEVVADVPEVAAVTPATPAPAPTTGDISIILAFAALVITAIGLTVISKKRNNIA